MKLRWKWEELDKDKWMVKTEKGYTLVIVMELKKIVDLYNKQTITKTRIA